MAVARCPYENVVSVFPDCFGGITISVRSAKYSPSGSPSWIDNQVDIDLDDVEALIAVIRKVSDEIREEKR